MSYEQAKVVFKLQILDVEWQNELNIVFKMLGTLLWIGDQANVISSPWICKTEWL